MQTFAGSTCADARRSAPVRVLRSFDKYLRSHFAISSWASRRYFPFLQGSEPRGLLQLGKVDVGERCQILQLLGAFIESDTLKRKAQGKAAI
jgi:hypothetical protein